MSLRPSCRTTGSIHEGNGARETGSDLDLVGLAVAAAFGALPAVGQVVADATLGAPEGGVALVQAGRVHNLPALRALHERGAGLLVAGLRGRTLLPAVPAA